MARTSQSGDDRREVKRFAISAPVTVICGDRGGAAYTRDLSNRGVYFYLALADNVLIGGVCHLSIELPPETTLSSWCLIRCLARVVRTDHVSAEITGIGAEFLEYSIQKNGKPFA